jgi:hypothetical protein
MSEERKVRRRRRIRHEQEEPLQRKRDEFRETRGEAEADTVSDAFVQAVGHERARQAAALSAVDVATRERVVHRLQAEHGNQYLQRLVVQRQGRPAQGAPLSGRDLLDPAWLRQATQHVIDREQAPVRSWLEQNASRLRALTVPEIILLVRQSVTEASSLAEVETESLVSEWASQQNITLPTSSSASGRPRVSVSDSQTIANIRNAVQSAFHVATDGINIVEAPGGRVNVAVSGATVELSSAGEHSGEQGQPGVSVSGTVGWNGSIGVATAAHGWHFTGALTRERWELNLTFPGDSAVPDLGQLSHVFEKGEGAMRGIVGAVNNAGDIHAAEDAIRPQLAPVKEAVEAVSGIAEAQTISFGLSASGPTGDGHGTPGGRDEASRSKRR